MSAGLRPAIVVVHEIFGLTPHIRSLCGRLEAAGYEAHAPDLFRDQLGGGYLPYTKEGKDKGLALKNGMGEARLAQQVAAAAAHAGAGQRRVAVMGFCLGGTLAWLAAGDPGVACAVGYYSVGIGRHLHHRPRGPVLMHFGRSDSSIPASEVRALREAQPQVEVHEYDAGHAFNRDDDGTYEPRSAGIAWQRTLGFLAKHLGAT